jgi:hypothetical protein
MIQGKIVIEKMMIQVMKIIMKDKIFNVLNNKYYLRKK